MCTLITEVLHLGGYKPRNDYSSEMNSQYCITFALLGAGTHDILCYQGHFHPYRQKVPCIKTNSSSTCSLGYIQWNLCINPYENFEVVVTLLQPCKVVQGCDKVVTTL